MSITTEIILRKPEVRAQIPVGKTKFEEDIAPLLDKVYIRKRTVGFTQSSVDRVKAALIAASANAPPIVPPPNRRPKRNNKKHVEAAASASTLHSETPNPECARGRPPAGWPPFQFCSTTTTVGERGAL
jgi:hypothetical protein